MHETHSVGIHPCVVTEPRAWPLLPLNSFAVITLLRGMTNRFRLVTPLTLGDTDATDESSNNNAVLY